MAAQLTCIASQMADRGRQVAWAVARAHSLSQVVSMGRCSLRPGGQHMIAYSETSNAGTRFLQKWSRCHLVTMPRSTAAHGWVSCINQSTVCVRVCLCHVCEASIASLIPDSLHLAHIVFALTYMACHYRMQGAGGLGDLIISNLPTLKVESRPPFKSAFSAGGALHNNTVCAVSFAAFSVSARFIFLVITKL